MSSRSSHRDEFPAQDSETQNKCKELVTEQIKVLNKERKTEQMHETYLTSGKCFFYSCGRFFQLSARMFAKWIQV